MHHKQTNVAVAADFTESQKILELADAIGPSICILKLHVDIIQDFSWNFIERLKEIAQKHQFLLCEDRKFADIGTIAQAQYKGGMYRICEWADIIIAHVITGKSCIEALAQVGIPLQKGIFLIAQLSTADNLIDAEYTKAVKKIASEYPEFVVGFIAQTGCSDNPHFLQVTPGISNMHQTRAHGQHYISIKQAIEENHSDIIIVGRDICQAKNPHQIAEEYRKEAWPLYIERLTNSSMIDFVAEI